jgi:hypothetical protein
MNPGEGIVPFASPAAGHGIPSEYDVAMVPGPTDVRWRSAPNGDSIEYSIRSTLCDTPIACGAGADFTYFRTFVCMPAAGSIRSLTVGIVGVDDGTRIGIVNSRFPSGFVPPNAFAMLFAGPYRSSDLAPFLVPGERNTIVLTHIDDCCQDAFVRGVSLETDTGALAIGEVAEVCNGLDDDCNGRVDDGLGQVSCGVGDCARTIDRCQNGAIATCVPGEPAIEVCDSFDNDCDGAIDEGLGMTSCGVGRCTNVVPNCAHGFPVDCVPGPPREEQCNGLDDDCDGVIDDGCVEAGPEPVLEAGVGADDAIDANRSDCTLDARCTDRPRILLEGRAGPIGCACSAAGAAPCGDLTIVAWFALMAFVPSRRRRRARR